MRMIRIEKFVDDVPQEQFSVPLGVARAAGPLLPGKALGQLREHGLDLDALLKDAGTGSAEQWLDVREGGVQKRVRITVT
jgi:hypothetical protein